MQQKTDSKKRMLTGLGVLTAIAILSSAYFANPPDGYTGAPGDNLCTSCHSLGSGMQDGNVVINGIPAQIMANQTYTLTVTVANPNGIAELAGFQMVVLDQNNNNAGTLSNAGPGSTLSTQGGRTYHDHNPAQSFPGSNVVSWTVDWLAPTGDGVITAYAAGNCANGNGNNNTDLIVTTSSSGTLVTPLLVEITNITNVSCFNAMDGAVTAEASFGMPGYTYNWSNGESGAMISGLDPGVYTVTVTDNGGATATASAEVMEPDEFVIVSANVDHVSCNGSADGQIILTLGGGTAPYQGAVGDTYTLNGLAAGDYNITVTDANGCTASELYTVNEPDALVIELQVIIEPDCAGDATGLITVQGTGGSGLIEYLWSNGETTNTIQNLEAGLYTVTITDDNGCTAMESIDLAEPDQLVLGLVSMDNVSCAGAADGQITVDATGGTGIPSFMWSTGATGPSISSLGPGDYTVTVTDENGCSDAATYTITEPGAIAVSINGTMSLACFGDTDGTLTAQPSGGTSPYSYAWSSGQTEMTITGVGAGDYTVTVTDNSGCSSTASASITQPGQLLPNATSTNETEPGLMDGTATANPSGGTPDYTYLWSTGATSQMISGLGVGAYTVTVTDANGCAATQTVTVSGTNCTIAASVETTNVLCFGEASGSALVNVTGALGSPSYVWSNGATTAMIMDLPAGMYSVTVTDTAGCVAIAMGTVGQPEVLSANLSVIHESAEGANDGSITSMPTGGTPPYSYLWSNGDTTSAIDELAPGEYILTVTDGNGCTQVTSATVNAFSCMLNLNVSSTSALCFGDSNGSATATVSGGVEPYSYLWSNGSTNAMITDLAAGTYVVMVTDAEGCSASQVGFVIQPEEISVVVDSIIPESSGGDGAIFITVSGGTPPYSYAWTSGGEPVSSEEDIDDLAAGDYSVEIMDANGCTIPGGAVTVMLTTGVNDLPGLANVKMWPNPVSELLILTFDQAVGDVVRLTVLSPTGARVYSVQGDHTVTVGNQLRIDVTGLHEGVYFLRVDHKEGAEVIPFIKIQ